VSFSLLASLLMAALAQEPDYVAGRSLYDAFEYEQALFRFQQALVKPGLTSKEQAEVSLWLALCLDGVGRASDADRAMGDAVALDAAAILPTTTSPAFEARFAAIKVAATATAATPATTTTTVAPTPTTTTSGPPVAAFVLGGGGGVALVGAAVLSVVAAERWGASTNETAFVDERAAAHGVYVGTLAGAVVTGVVGAGLVIGAVLAAGGTDDDDVKGKAVTGSGG
jgi:hypothetical protein